MASTHGLKALPPASPHRTNPAADFRPGSEWGRRSADERFGLHNQCAFRVPLSHRTEARRCLSQSCCRSDAKGTTTPCLTDPLLCPSVSIDSATKAPFQAGYRGRMPARTA